MNLLGNPPSVAECVRMKRVAVLLTILALILSVATEVSDPVQTTTTGLGFSPRENRNVATASGGGDTRSATQFFTRKITSQQLDILNTYANTTDHSEELSLSDYQVSGWKLYKVQIDIGTMTATPEKEVVGVTYENFNFQREGLWTISDLEKLADCYAGPNTYISSAYCLAILDQHSKHAGFDLLSLIKKLTTVAYSEKPQSEAFWNKVLQDRLEEAYDIIEKQGP